MLLTTTDVRADYEVLGIVRGNKVRAVHLGKDILAGIRKLVGGDVSEYAELMSEVRDSAFEEMISEAEKLGANAIVGIRFSSSTISTGMAEIYVYGTAIKI
ncbi:MAG: YbjQ family protein [Bacillota bacterium]|nr:YbjQ family protein [Bacillota bacterium]MDW7685327.1 YbjQ family protein [Bacillota bacterium]